MSRYPLVGFLSFRFRACAPGVVRFRMSVSQTKVQVAMNESNSVEKPKFLTPANLALRWGWHVVSVRRWLRKRRIETVRIDRANRILIPIEAVEAVEAAGRIAPAA